MSIQLKLVAWILSIVAVAGLLYGCFAYGKHVQSLEDNSVRDSAVIAQQEKNTSDLITYAETIKKANETHDQNQSIITGLHDDISKLRVRTPTCTVSSSSEAAASKDGTSGVFPVETQSAFDTFRSGLESDYSRCDEINIDAIRLNAETK